MKKWFMGLALFSCAAFCSEGVDFPFSEVQEMAARDKEVRLSWICSRDEQIARSIRLQEQTNTKRLKEIIEVHGLPQDGSEEDLSCLMQLALRSSDLDFQKELIELASYAGDPWKHLFDMLEDRVLLRQGLSQRYGSHLHWEREKLVPYPIEDVEKADLLRAEIGEPPLHQYIAMMEGIGQALKGNNDGDLYKVFFNIAHDFNKNPQDYLYYAAFEPQASPPEDDEGAGFLAFEDPASAAAYILCKTEILGDACWVAEDSQLEYLSTLVFVRNQEDLNRLQQQIYISLVSREGFLLDKPGKSRFQNRLLVSAEQKRPVEEFLCGSVLEALIGGGSALRIHDGISEYTIKDSMIKEMLLCTLFFDLTLENEVFE